MKTRFNPFTKSPEARPQERPDFNLWLGEDGTIHTHLSLFDQRSSRILRDEAARLNRLAGKRPMQLVMQRSQREDLLRAAGIGHPTVWRVGHGRLEWAKLLDCGDEVCGVAAFESGENESRWRRDETFGQPQPKR